MSGRRSNPAHLGGVTASTSLYMTAASSRHLIEIAVNESGCLHDVATSSGGSQKKKENEEKQLAPDEAFRTWLEQTRALGASKATRFSRHRTQSSAYKSRQRYDFATRSRHATPFVKSGKTLSEKSATAEPPTLKGARSPVQKKFVP